MRMKDLSATHRMSLLGMIVGAIFFSCSANAMTVTDIKNKVFSFFKTPDAPKPKGVEMTTALTIYHEENPTQVVLYTTNRNEIHDKLKEIGIVYEIWPIDKTINAQSSHEQILSAYEKSIQDLVAKGGYQSFDVIGLNPDHPDKVALRQKFLKEHTHAEDEVRFFVAGSGLFTVHKNRHIYNILCTEGDLINVPAGTLHWFDMGPEPHFVAIRIFNNPEGWVANYTGSEIAEKFPRYETNADHHADVTEMTAS